MSERSNIRELSSRREVPSWYVTATEVDSAF